MDEVAENSDSLMERYLEGEEISHDEIVTALKDGTDHGDIFPVTCGVATRTSAPTGCSTRSSRTCPRRSSTAALELDGHDARARRGRRAVRLRLQDAGRPVRRAHQPLPRLPGRDAAHDSQVLNTRTHAKERIGQLLVPQGKEIDARRRVRAGRHRRGRQAQGDPRRATGSPSATSRSRCRRSSCRRRSWRSRSSRSAKGDEDKVFTALRRLQEEDPTIDLHRDPQTGEQIVAGLSQIHVEVIVDRLKSRFGAEVDAQAAARALPGDDPRHREGARPPQEADRRPRPVRRLPHRDRAAAPTATVRVRQRDQGRRDPDRLHPRGREGRARGDEHGAVAGYPVKGVRVRLFDGSYHTVDSSEMAFKIAGLDRDEARRSSRRSPVLLEPIMLVTRLGARGVASAT